MLLHLDLEDDFFERLFPHPGENSPFDPSVFVSFHKSVFAEILNNAGMDIMRLGETALVEAAERTFLDIGFLLERSNYVGEGKYLKRDAIDYRTDIFDVMAFTSVNILRREPILQISARAQQDQTKLTTRAKAHPNLFAVLSLYDEAARGFCAKYGFEREKETLVDKLDHVLERWNDFVLSETAFQQMGRLLRG